MDMAPTFYLAPIRGITDRIYRNMFHRHFSHFDGAIAPFIAAGKSRKGHSKIVRDHRPAHKGEMPFVPQLLTNDTDTLVALANLLFRLGHEQVNLNLGCPHRQVTTKKKGAGLLQHPDRLESLLSNALPQLAGPLSIKIRLGYDDPSQILELLPMLNRFKLKELTIHGRTAAQMYTGDIHIDIIQQCATISRHPIVYNGDILTTADLKHTREKLPSVNKFMIGRGALQNPFFVGELKGIPNPDPPTAIKTIRSFHDDMVTEYASILSGEKHLLDKMKGHWSYLIDYFDNDHQQLKKINKSQTLNQYRQTVDAVFNNITVE